MRFIKTTAKTLGEEPDSEYYATSWWLDTSRPINHQQGYVAVQTEVGKNPNDFVKIYGMRNLFTDQCEYYHVCKSCYGLHSHQQWSGSTRSRGDWRSEANDDLKEHEAKKGWCEFCDPIFGNGGWTD